ncbi:polymorphic toxin-type HINT domain-containing protein [Sinomicrobium weinanense]|uniref:GIY-YIG domain-containing protein n=1 Tax=Sinomicrobium weinanense TaxID=2842200 RepID=A0A926JUM4_9FLAO|nr:polymorphic toxin-type HINT domain-containing protein [Sinomicrobium weinanense]MBC9797863.1 hypothetical protein [Sinomicrobium weinanense]MBU3122237.1 hypothetical protein [Sinomicrobium weinanense]
MGKIITEKDFWTCSMGNVPAQLQGSRKMVKKQSEEKYITVVDTATSSSIDFGCKKYMFIMALIAAAAVVIAALTVATGGVALAVLVGIGAAAGAAGAVIGGVVGGLLCGQKAAALRKWTGSKPDLILQGAPAITSDHKMICPIGGEIKNAPNIKSWRQAIALGAANYISGIMEGMTNGALIGLGGGALSGSAGAFASGGLRGLGSAGFNFFKSAPGYIKSNLVGGLNIFAKGWLADQGVEIAASGTENTLRAYGETGQTGVGAFWDGAVEEYTESAVALKNIATFNGSWSDAQTAIMLLVPGSKGNKPKPADSGGNNIPADGNGTSKPENNKNPDNPNSKNNEAENGPKSSPPADTSKPPKKGKGEAYEGPPSYQQLGTKQPCFLPGTLIKTPKGDIAIENLKTSDIVYAYDFNQNRLVEKRISRLYGNWTNKYYKIIVDGENEIFATKRHLFWIEDQKKWMPVQDLEKGMQVQNIQGSYSSITGIAIFRGAEESTYNFEVEGLHNYFVHPYGVLVHNQNKPSIFESTTKKNTEIYEIVDTQTQEVVYVGQTTQGTNTRFEQHVNEKGWDPSRYQPRTVKEGNWTPYEAHVWEQHYIEKNGGKDKLLNKKNAITEAKYDKFENLHNPC